MENFSFFLQKILNIWYEVSILYLFISHQANYNRKLFIFVCFLWTSFGVWYGILLWIWSKILLLIWFILLLIWFILLWIWFILIHILIHILINILIHILLLIWLGILLSFIFLFILINVHFCCLLFSRSFNYII